MRKKPPGLGEARRAGVPGGGGGEITKEEDRSPERPREPNRTWRPLGPG